MTGGQVIIPIRGRNNEKIQIGLTSTDLKLGTYAKIERSCRLQKQIVFNDLYVASLRIPTCGGGRICSAEIYSGHSYYVFEVIYKTTTSASSYATIAVYIRDDDIAYYAAV